MTDYIKSCLARRLNEINDELDALRIEARLLKLGTEGKGLIVCECMTDNPIVLFVGDTVMSKYGDHLEIESYNRELIYFVKGQPLQHHRISHVLTRGPLAEKLAENFDSDHEPWYTGA